MKHPELYVYIICRPELKNHAGRDWDSPIPAGTEKKTKSWPGPGISQRFAAKVTSYYTY